tara:strand:+ start:2555 stop:2875 length:321 start_codon:yes stop_codon:yes gene_type:complete
MTQLQRTTFKQMYYKYGGTWGLGDMTIDYARLVSLFGEPDAGDGDKTDAEWRFIFKDQPLTIYNYKTGINYRKHRGSATEDIKLWHIGGNDATDVEAFKKLLEEAN